MFNKSRGGPKTAIGKKRSSQNARRHGLFANEFNHSTADEAEYRKLSAGLRETLKPSNAVLDFIFEDVVASAWKIKIGLRFEQQEVLKEFSLENGESSEKPQGVGSSFPYGLKPRKLEQAIRLIEELRAAVERSGVLPAEFQMEVTQTFGAELWKILTEWAPQDAVSVWVARLTASAVERSHIFGYDFPDAKIPAEEEKKYCEENALKQQEMLCKILDIYTSILAAEPRSAAWGGGVFLDERASRLDLAIRYGTTARRDFYRSLREYWEAEARA